MIKVLIADDQELIRESLKIVLSADEKIQVTGTVSNGSDVIKSISKDKPNVILMDIRMPQMDGVQCTKVIKESYPDIKIIVLTTFDDDEYIFDALKYGASGYLLKGVSMKELIEGIHTVAGGGAMMNPDIATKVVRLFSRLAKGGLGIKVNSENVKSLGKTEWKVIVQIGRGLSNKEIAKVLFLSEGTVRNYLSQILNKLELRDRTQLAIWAVENGVTSGKMVADYEE